MLTLNDGRSELWQWDTGRKLTVDADCSQVHFSNKVFGRSVDVDVVDGVASIPDILLQTDKELMAWAFVGTAENGYTKISKVFRVNKRNKPADYVFTEPDQTTLEEILNRIEDLENRPGADISKEDIQDAVNEYLDNNPVSVNETDPTVPDWAKRPQKPTYTAKEVGAMPAGTPIPEPYVLPIANPETLGGVKPVAKGADMTQEVGVDEQGGLWTAPGGGSSEWTKIGEVTLTGKTLPITAVADNMVKVDTTSGITVNKNIVVHKKDYSDFNAVRFNSTDVAGQYVLKNLDNGVINVDESWVGREIEIPDADYLRIAIGGKFNYLKVVVTAPAIVFHGSRTGFTFGYAFECPGTVNHFQACSVIYEAETMPCPVDGYMYVQGMWRGGKIGVKQTYSEMRMTKKATVPAEFTMGHYNGILAIGTKVELWGKA